jgi:DNA-binding Lrp family transcriptional regulator
LEIFKLGIKAYILIQTGLGKAKKISEILSKTEGVIAAHPVTGLYDVIAYIEMPDLKTLSEFILEKVQSLDGVQRTHTAIVI